MKAPSCGTISPSFGSPIGSPVLPPALPALQQNTPPAQALGVALHDRPPGAACGHAASFHHQPRTSNTSNVSSNPSPPSSPYDAVLFGAAPPTAARPEPIVSLPPTGAPGGVVVPPAPPPPPPVDATEPPALGDGPRDSTEELLAGGGGGEAALFPFAPVAME